MLIKNTKELTIGDTIFKEGSIFELISGNTFINHEKDKEFSLNSLKDFETIDFDIAILQKSIVDVNRSEYYKVLFSRILGDLFERLVLEPNELEVISLKEKQLVKLLDFETYFKINYFEQLGSYLFENFGIKIVFDYIKTTKVNLIYKQNYIPTQGKEINIPYDIQESVNIGIVLTDIKVMQTIKKYKFENRMAYIFNMLKDL